MALSQELHSYPIFSEDWGADEYVILLLYITCNSHQLRTTLGSYC